MVCRVNCFMQLALFLFLKKCFTFFKNILPKEVPFSIYSEGTFSLTTEKQMQELREQILLSESLRILSNACAYAKRQREMTAA